MNGPPISGGHANGQTNHPSFLGQLESQLEDFRRSDAQRDALVQDLWRIHTQTDIDHTGSYSQIRRAPTAISQRIRRL